MFRNIPYRYRLPLQVSLIIMTTGLLFAFFLGWQNYRATHRALNESADLLVSTYARALAEPLKHHDIWRAYSLIRKKPDDPAYRTPLGNETVLVFDRGKRLFVSSDPERYPIDSNGREMENLISKIDGRHNHISLGEEDVTAIARTVSANGTRLGQVLLILPDRLYLYGVYPVIGQIAAVTFILLLLLVPAGWLAGRRLSDPLSNLKDCLERLERDGPAAAICSLQEEKGELGDVGKRLRRVLNQLAEKAALEQQMVAEERLAAIGRLAAGVAHEVNNPLAGMLTTLDTFKRHGNDPRVARETIELLERGLEQIRHTVSALLVQSRGQDRPFTAMDLEDIRALLDSDLQKKRVRFTCRDDMPENLDLPSSDLRQILINLLLNAIHAVPEGGRIELYIVTIENDRFLMEVANEGNEIAGEQLATLFEPFSGAGMGLGLWVTKQLVERLQGKIEVESAAGWSRFRVIVPLVEKIDE